MDVLQSLQSLEPSTIVLIVAAGIVLVSVIVGFARGFLGSAFDMVQIILAVVLVLLLQPTIENLIREKTPLEQIVYENVEKTVRTVLEETIPNLTEQGFSGLQEGLGDAASSAQGLLPEEISGLGDQIASILPEGFSLTGEEQTSFLNELIDQYLPIPALKAALEKNNEASTYEKLGAADYPAYVATFITNLVVTAIVFVTTLAIVLIALQIVKGALDLMGSIPLISFANRVAGGVLGLVRGIFFLWLIELVILVFGSQTDWGKIALAAIEEVQVLKVLHQNNLLIKLLVEFGVRL